MKDIREVREDLSRLRVVIGSLNQSKEGKLPHIKLDGFNGVLQLELPDGAEELRFINLGKPLPSKDGTLPDFVLNSVFIRLEGPEESTLVNIGSLQKSKKEDGHPFVKVDHYKGSLNFIPKEGPPQKVDYIFFDTPLPGAPEFVLNSAVIKLKE